MVIDFHRHILPQMDNDCKSMEMFRKGRPICWAAVAIIWIAVHLYREVSEN